MTPPDPRRQPLFRSGDRVVIRGVVRFDVAVGSAFANVNVEVGGKTKIYLLPIEGLEPEQGRV